MFAHDLIADPRAFTTGTLARDAQGKPSGLSADSKQFDCLGALLWVYPDASVRRPSKEAAKAGAKQIAKEVFDLCQARFGHRCLGKLDHPESVSLLRDAGA